MYFVFFFLFPPLHVAILKKSATTVAEFHPAIVANLNDIVKILIIVEVAELDASFVANLIILLNFHHCFTQLRWHYEL